MTNSGHQNLLWTDWTAAGARIYLIPKMIVESIRRDCPWPEPKTN